MLQRFALGADVRQVVFGHGKLVLSLAPSEEPAITEEEAIAKITTHRAANRRKQDVTDVSADAAMYSHDRHGIIFGFCEQANSYA